MPTHIYYGTIIVVSLYFLACVVYCVHIYARNKRIADAVDKKLN
jgi:hypothetical protein